ncbi:serine/threonine-protein kinase [Nannocystis bainbridge]|uniref:Serine/threonine-protein kinase n=1 Tax=Nannocystis bainbridge TaxID=2995303 RepID=A0ABT5DSK9_9BACT|nr:serine/threonine-protein kinase [Nannocystis bainbridge]MDC0716622.1 serine/threonine-protein kinase [Nannocystis bainbridge]
MTREPPAPAPASSPRPVPASLVDAASSPATAAFEDPARVTASSPRLVTAPFVDAPSSPPPATAPFVDAASTPTASFVDSALPRPITAALDEPSRITVAPGHALASDVERLGAAPVRLGRFTVLERLGAGGMGVVYAAYDELLDRKVALKLLHHAGGRGDDRLLREAQAMARLSHPNIVSVFEVVGLGAQHFIAMEFVRGQSLDAWLAAAARPWQDVLPVLLAAGRGLAAAHRAGIVHRDYKPHNTLVGVDGSVKVADFGLARAFETGDTDPTPPAASPGRRLLDVALTRAGAVLGTPAYMAPEQHAGLACDERSDQFSFCVTAYEALYGAPPFPRSSLAALRAAIDRGEVEPAPPGSAVPAWLRRAVVRGLAPDPARRHASMDALLAALAGDPAAARRRRLQIGLFGAGLGLLGLLGGWFFAAAGPQACPDGAAALHGVWDDARRDRLGAAILGLRQPFAPATWAHLEARLGAYAGEWAAMHDDACQAHRAGRQSDTQYDLRMRCLELRRTDLAALTGVLAEVDAASLSGAALAADALPPIAACGDLEGLLADPLRPPRDPALAAAVARFQAGLAHVRALESTGLYERAVLAADALAPAAAATGHRPFGAELALSRGRALLASDPAAADEALTTAFREGLRSGHDRVATEALARRLFVRGYRFGRPEAAAADHEVALALLDRIGDRGALRGELLNNAGAVALGQGAWARAEALLVAAVAAKTAALGPDAGELVYTLANLGTLRNDLYRTGAATQALQAALAIGERAFGAAHPTTLLVRANLGMAQLKHRRLADAESTLLAVRAAAEARPDPDHAALAFVEQQLAWLALVRRRPAVARDHLALAETLLLGRDDPLALANIAALAAHAAALLGDRDATWQHHARAEALLTQALPPDHARRRDLECDRAELELTLGRPAEALASARATAHALARAPSQALLLARAHELEARACQALGRADEALLASEAAVAVLAEVVAEDNPRTAGALAQLGVSEAAAGRPEQARAHLERAEQIYVAAADPDLPALARLRFDRARLVADPSQARQLAETALATLASADNHEAEAEAVRTWLATH